MLPNPIFARKKTTIINDGWGFSFDGEKWRDIILPFCPESELSGICYTGFIPVCYYKKKFTAKKCKERLFLHFGAVDYRCETYLNGSYVGGHVGGYTPFSFDITDKITDGENEIYLVVRDNEYGKAASGKQSQKEKSYGCFYTRVTGIWQNVWIEEVPEKHVEEFYFYPNTEDCSVKVNLKTNARGEYAIDVCFDGKSVGKARGSIDYAADIDVKLAEKHLWEVGKGNLYDVKIRFEEDEVESYFGLREVKYIGYDFFLSGKKTFQNLVLDQGYCPSGICTSPSEDAMQRDIDLAKELGFNGARLHQKVFDPRFLYLCDKAGYMVWGEFASWGVDYFNLDGLGQFLSEWQEVLKRDFNHPSIITWCPLNETWGDLNDSVRKREVKFIDAIYEFTKIFDTTRPCIDVSGGHHGHGTDVYDFHCYEKPANLKKYLDELEEHGKLEVPLLYCDGEDLKYDGKLPVNLSEYGGIAISAEAKTGEVNEGAVVSEEKWGYGDSPDDEDGFIARFEELVDLIRKYKKISGVCYTQLYDIEQEQNGFYNYDRTDKFTKAQKERIRKANERYYAEI